MMPERQPLRAIGLKLASVAVFITMMSLVKYTAHAVPPGQQVFFRSFFALPALFAWMVLRGDRLSVLRTRMPVGHLLRGTIGTTSMGLGFAATGLLPLPEVTALGYITPLLIVVFAALILGERVGVFRAVMVMIGLTGVLVVLSPRLGEASAGGLSAREGLGVVMVLSATMFTALAMIFVRRLVQKEPAATVVFWFTVSSTAMSLLTLPFGWVIPDAATTGFLVLTGLLGGLGQILMTSAYRYGEASLVAPFEYASMLFAVAIGLVFFAEVPKPQTLIGAAIVISAGTLVILREGRQQRRWRRLRASAQSSKPNIT